VSIGICIEDNRRTRLSKTFCLTFKIKKQGDEKEMMEEREYFNSPTDLFEMGSKKLFSMV
jgi:hypothetical protein